MAHRQGFYEKYIKRPQDFVLATAATVVLSPVMLATGLLVKKKLGTPVIFSQERPGLNGKIFKLHKFRSMTDEKDDQGNLLPDDVRLTSFGNKLRSTSLDELPELFNIIKGDMSVVGPRPLLPQYLDRYNSYQARRHEVRPGFTGLAQVHGRNAISWEEKFDWDVKYVDHVSFLGDWKIIFDTVKTVLKHEGISSGTTATMEEFMGSADATPRKKTLLILANDISGLYLFRRELVQELLKDRRVIINAPDSEMVKKFIEMGCKFLPCSYLDRRGTNPFKDLSLLKHYSSVLKQEQPDVVLTYTIKPTAYGGLMCGLQKVPYISNITGLGTSIENGGLLAFISTSLYKAGLRKAECVFFQNETNRKLFLGKRIVKGKTKLVPGSGVNLQQHCVEPYPDESEGIRFLFVGRIMKDKGVGELIEAFKNIYSRYSNVSIDVVGPQEEDYTEAFSSAGEFLHYLGAQTEMHQFYKICHCVVLPSYHEGTANVMLEASATARPVITTTVPGCRETFDEGITGFGCEARNAESLVTAIEKFLKLTQEERKWMGLAARAKMEREYDRSLVIKAYKEEIELIEKEEEK